MISNEKKFSHETMKNNNKISKEKKQTTQSNINCYNSLLIDRTLAKFKRGINAQMIKKSFQLSIETIVSLLFTNFFFPLHF